MSWAKRNRKWLEKARERWAPVDPEPLRVRAWLAAPVAWDTYDHLMIEGLLQFVVVMRETGRLPDDVFAGCALDVPLEDTDIQVPIVDEVLPGCEVPIARASAGWPSTDSVASVRWRRSRPRGDRYGASVVNASSGNTKAMNLPAPVVVTQFVDWWVYGDRAMIEDLLQDAPTVGGKRSGGLGYVHGWEVVPDEDWSWFGPSGRLMRALPASYGRAQDATAYQLRVATVRAPYWHPRSRMLCCVPIQRLGESADVLPGGVSVG